MDIAATKFGAHLHVSLCCDFFLPRNIKNINTYREREMSTPIPQTIKKKLKKDVYPTTNHIVGSLLIKLCLVSLSWCLVFILF